MARASEFRRKRRNPAEVTTGGITLARYHSRLRVAQASSDWAIRRKGRIPPAGQKAYWTPNAKEHMKNRLMHG